MNLKSPKIAWRLSAGSRWPVVGLNLVPMIDVVFLLMIFFLLSANFRGNEGFLPADSFVIDPADDASDFQTLARRLSRVLADQGRRADDPVKLVPDWHTRWDHVVKAYDALWKINLTNVVFALVEE
jgi:biopolymer transport protein ExbD